MRYPQTILALCFIGISQAAYAQDVIRIEEDWELVIAEPDSQLDAPQISILMFPFGDEHDAFIQLDVNHASLPSFSSGGLQVSAVVDYEVIQSSRVQEGECLQSEGETITWTQAVLKTSSGIQFGLIDASSETWGDFSGASSGVFLSFGDAGQASLNGYRPEQTLSNSGIPFAGNRVVSLKLKKMRVYGSNGEFNERVIDISPGQ